MRASTVWFIAAAFVFSAFSGCQSLKWPSTPKMPGSSSLAKLNPKNWFKKKKTDQQLADNGRPTLPSASDVARGSVPYGGNAPPYQPSAGSYADAAGSNYPTAGSGAYGSSGAGGGYGAGSGYGTDRGYGTGGGSYAGQPGNGGFYREEQTYRDATYRNEASTGSRGGALAGNQYADLGNGRDAAPYSGSTTYYDPRNPPIRTADGRNREPWDGSSNVQTNGTEHPLASNFGGDRYGSSRADAPRDNASGGSTGSGNANRWSSDSYNDARQPREFDPTTDDRFGGGDSYGSQPASFDSYRDGGYDSQGGAAPAYGTPAANKDPGLVRPVPGDSRYGAAGTSGRSSLADSSLNGGGRQFGSATQFGSGTQFGNNTTPSSTNSLAPYRRDSVGNYTLGSIQSNSGASPGPRSSSGTMLTGGTDRAPQASNSYSPIYGTDSGRGESSRFESATAGTPWQTGPSSASSGGAATSSYRDYNGYGGARTATGSGTRSYQ